MTRDELQRSTADYLWEKKRLICQWATGTGKSSVVIKFIFAHPRTRTLILVPEQNNISNWRKEFDKFGMMDFGVDIACYASFHKYKDTNWDLLVFDEAPHVDTDLRRAICRSVTGTHILALGAVITDEERQTLESIYGKFALSNIPLSVAIANGYLPSPEVKVLHCVLDNIEKTHWHKGKMYTAQGLYDIYQREVEGALIRFRNQSSDYNKQKMLRAGMVRKRFLGKMKEEYLRKICGELEKRNKRFICFCASVKQAEELGKDKAFTSKTPVSLKVLERFNDGLIDSIYVVGKLVEGQNLNNIECGVLGQLGGTHRITVQEVGRVLRAENPVIYVPVFDDTKDIGFLKTVTDNIPARYIKHYQY